ncbi:MAG: glycosyltransferase family 4 protein [Bacteroidota bacterium]
MAKKHKVLVVGQTPPPFGGQAVMIQNMLEGPYPRIKFYHVKMDFSVSMDQMGKFKLRKLWVLAKVILGIYYHRIFHGTKVMYYPPAGPDRMPIFRDLVILNTTRWLFKKVVFHFHASGMSEYEHGFEGFTLKLFERAYFRPEATIRLAAHSPQDGRFFQAKNEFIIPNGLEDEGKRFLNGHAVPRTIDDDAPNILFVGLLKESKGILILLEAARICAEQGLKFSVNVMGRWESEDIKNRAERFVQQHQLQEYVNFLGVRTGDEKWGFFSYADIFCFPTFFESETQSLVLIEAMQFELPVVTTKWRGIPSIVEEGDNGFMVPVKSGAAVAEKLALLIQDEEMRKKMGQAGRQMYLERFSYEVHHRNMEDLFVSLCS